MTPFLIMLIKTFVLEMVRLFYQLHHPIFLYNHKTRQIDFCKFPFFLVML